MYLLCGEGLGGADLIICKTYHNMKKLVSLLLLFVPLLVIGQEKEMSIFWRDTLNGRVRMMCKYFVQGSYVDTLCEVDDEMLDRKVCFDSLGRLLGNVLKFLQTRWEK